MWAGSRLEWLSPLRLGATARKTSTIASIEEKQGRSGPLVFVTVRHELEGPEGLAIREEHDIVYREAPERGSAVRGAGEAAPKGQWARRLRPDPVLLFRYSALTFNGHRIHYDEPYAREAEGYPGLVVHGPLLATLMVDLARRPLFCGEEIVVGGEADDRGAEVWVAGPDGGLCMRGRVELGS